MVPITATTYVWSQLGEGRYFSEPPKLISVSIRQSDPVPTDLRLVGYEDGDAVESSGE